MGFNKLSVLRFEFKYKKTGFTGIEISVFYLKWRLTKWIMSTVSELPHRSNTVPKDAGSDWGSLWECGEGVSNSTREEYHEHALEC